MISTLTFSYPSIHMCPPSPFHPPSHPFTPHTPFHSPSHPCFHTLVHPPSHTLCRSQSHHIVAHTSFHPSIHASSHRPFIHFFHASSHPSSHSPFHPSSHPPFVGPNRTISSLTHDAYCCIIFQPIMHPLDPPPVAAVVSAPVVVSAAAPAPPRGIGNNVISINGTGNTGTNSITPDSINNPRDYRSSQASKIIAVTLPFPTERIDYEHCGQVNLDSYY